MSRPSNRKKSIKLHRAALFLAPPLLVLPVVFILFSFFSFGAVDRALSGLISQRLPTHVSLEGLRVKPFTGLRFEKLTAGSVRGGRGWVRWDGRIYLSELTLSSDLLHAFPSLPADSRFASDLKAVKFEGASFDFKRSGALQRLRILRMKSSLLEIRGSICWDRGRLEKADLAVLLPAVSAERLPERWRRHLSSARGGKKMLKCAYKNDHLTFYGAAGPLLRAVWSPDPSE